MVPGKYKISKLLAIIAGLLITQACGGSGGGGGGGGGDGSSGGGSTDGVTISSEVSNPSDMGVGDIIMTLFGDGESVEIDFAGVEDSSKYYLAIGGLDYDYSSNTFYLSDLMAWADGSDYSESEFDEWADWGAAEGFHQNLRNMELAMSVDFEAEIADSGANFSAAKASITKVTVGETESFRVLNSLTSLSSYTTVTGEIKCIGANVIMYVDTEVTTTHLTQSDIDELCADFNDQIAEERAWFGNESDVNGDGKVAALLTPQVNRLGSMGGGIITGFFLASDLYSRASAPISNEREIVYTLIPDPNGDFGLVIPKAFAIDNLLTAVLPHELQHAISYNRHVFVQGGSPESNWMNEAMSHLTEDLVGFGQENYSRAEIFLDSPASYALVTSGSPGLGERGMSYFFIRFLYEQSGYSDAFLAGLYDSSRTGVSNLEHAFAASTTVSKAFDQFGEFFMRWMAALVLTDRGISADSRYVYDNNDDGAGPVSKGQTGTCLICSPDDGRGTVLSGPYIQTYTGSVSGHLYSSGVRFYDVATVPDTITLNATTGSFGAVLIRRQ